MTSRRATRIAFGVIIVFVLAQVVWWIIFQERYISGVTETTLANWRQDATAVNALLERSSEDTALVEEVRRDYPHLQFQNGRFVLDRSAVQTFTEEQRGYIRMFAFEGPFFSLVVLTGLFIIAKSLRTERELKRRQQNFLNAVSHEFKTPLSTLRLLVETALYRSLKPEKQRDYLERMERELTRLEATSEQVLASARLEQHTTQPLQKADLNSAVQSVVNQLRGSLEARGVVLETTYTDAPIPVSLDPNALSIILNNLLDNAAKYSSGKGRKVRVRLEAKRHVAAIHIEDDGVGLDPKEARRVFDKFYRVGNELTRESTGVGLGLHLVKSLTEAMNGWVRCESPNPTTGRGSRFSVVFPKRVEASVATPLPVESSESRTMNEKAAMSSEQ